MKIKKIQDKLNLENDGGLSFFFIGTGSAFSKKFFQNNFIAIKGKNHILIDCGTLCPFALEEYKTDISKIRNFFLTHSHADHIGGMEEVAFTNYYGTKKSPNIVINDKYKKTLWEDSLRGGMGYATSKDGDAVTFDDFFVQQKPEKIKVNGHVYEHAVIGGKNGIDLKIFETVHLSAPNAKGKHFHSNGVVVDSRILFSGDTVFNKALFERILSDFDIEYIFHECTTFKKGAVHTGLEELLKLPQDIRKKIYLCHYNDDLAKENVKAMGFGGFVKRGFYYNFDE